MLADLLGTVGLSIVSSFSSSRHDHKEEYNKQMQAAKKYQNDLHSLDAYPFQGPVESNNAIHRIQHGRILLGTVTNGGSLSRISVFFVIIGGFMLRLTKYL